MAIVVPETIVTFLERLFVGPVWPASIMVCLLLAYTLVALLGIFDLDLDVDADVSPDMDLGGPDLGGPDVGGPDVSGPELGGADASGPEIGGDLLGGIGGMTVRWMNLDRLPLILWLSAFTVSFWAVSYFLWYGFDVRRYSPTLVTSLLLTARNVVIATTVTKFVTEPLSRLFVPPPQYSPSTLIGQHCTVSTSEVNESFGQAKFRTDAAPLLLNIRTDGEHLAKGTRVQIIAFDADRRLYKVTAAPEEVSS